MGRVKLGKQHVWALGRTHSMGKYARLTTIMLALNVKLVRRVCLMLVGRDQRTSAFLSF